ncbi:hypothetical protein AX14_006556 [Amanita brunnescens Koide BX004]|nr:hypothetical protein AX14_012274 [Amanita brunnescens Koide BX004]KAF8728497.1 hypothetical protein AX14_006556 [Amanita brunnescens Koide BX004]
MLARNIWVLALAIIPSLVSAALFPSNSMVKMLDEKAFRKAMKANQTSAVAFVAPWCGHCQRMVPQYSKAAQSLHPLVPAYAVDCDNEGNKPLCAEQRVQGFPTLKVFPRGNEVAPMVYESGDRSASAIFKWVSLRVPNHIDKISNISDIETWAKKDDGMHRALLLTKEKTVPLLWKVLGSKYHGLLRLAVIKNEKGDIPSNLGVAENAKVVLYLAGSSKPIVYEGSFLFRPEWPRHQLCV